jgi:hypothetical protein
MARTTTTHRLSAIIEMFADATVGECYNQGRLVTEETDSGNVALVGYGWAKLAEYDETEGHVTVYFGHKSTDSTTLTRWLNRITEEISARRDVTISHESPVVRSPNDGVEYIGAYIGSGPNSSVEERARKHVINSLEHVRKVL